MVPYLQMKHRRNFFSLLLCKFSLMKLKSIYHRSQLSCKFQLRVAIFDFLKSLAVLNFFAINLQNQLSVAISIFFYCFLKRGCCCTLKNKINFKFFTPSRYSTYLSWLLEHRRVRVHVINEAKCWTKLVTIHWLWVKSNRS